MTRSYAVLGAGAVGGYYGARLAAAGHEVSFVARSDVDHLRREGLLVESPGGDIRLPEVAAFAAPEEVPPVDVVLVGLKGGVPNPAAELLPAMLHDGTVVVTLQNGLGIEEELAPVVGDRPLLGGLCFICSNKVGPGHVRHLDYGLVSLGQHGAAGATETVRAVAADLERAGVPVQVEDDLLLARWKKLIWNVPFNGLSVVLGALPGDLLAHPGARALVVSIMDEVRLGAAAFGRVIPDEFVEGLLATTERMTPYKTSMLLDYESGRPVEAETILGNPVRAAASKGVDLPLIQALYRQVTYLDARNRAAWRADGSAG